MTIDKIRASFVAKVRAEMPRILKDQMYVPADRVVSTILCDATVSDAVSQFFSDLHAMTIRSLKDDVFFLAVVEGGCGIDLNSAARYPRLSEDNELLSILEVCEIIQGAKVLCESVEDNDIERWYLTRGLQFVRETGVSGGRFYVVPAHEAGRMLDGFIDDGILQNLRSSGLLEMAPAPAL